MNNSLFQTAPLVSGTLLAALPSTGAAQSKSPDEAVNRIKEQSDKVRSEAWQEAAAFGAPAIKPLSALLNHENHEVVRAAKRALWQIVHRAGRPGAAQETQAVVAELIPLLNVGAPNARRELLWMISELGGDETVAPLAALLSDKDLRDDACLTLQRIPGNKALAALKQGFTKAPEDFKPNIAQSLRARGEKIDGYPSQKLVPTKPTAVKGGPKG